MPDTFGPFIVKRGSDGVTFPTEVGRVNAPGPYTLDDQLADADPAQSPTGKWIYTVSETTSGNVVVPYNTVPISSIKQGTCQKVWQISPLSSSVPGNDCYVNGLKGDALGNMFAAGWFGGIANFGGGNISSQNHQHDAWVGVYDSANSLGFLNHYGNGSLVQFTALTVDSSGNAIVTGSFQGANANLGGTDLVYTGNPNENILVAKYSNVGSHQWSVKLGLGTGMSIASSGTDIYVFAKDPGANLVIRKLSGADGSVVWTKTITSDSNANAYAIAILSNKVLVTGSYDGTLDYGSGTISGGGMFLLQFNTSDGAFATLARSYPGCLGRGIAISQTGNIVLTGSISAGATVGGEASFLSGSFVSGYTSSADFLWQYFNGNGSLNTGLSVTVSSTGILVVTFACDSLYFGPGTDPIQGNGTTDYGAAVFAISGDAKPTWKWSQVSGRQVSGTGTSRGLSSGIDSSGRVFTGGYFNQVGYFGDGLTGTAGSLQSAGFIAQYSA